MRLRISFSKLESIRFTSHLDLFRTWERTLRRAGLPLAYSRGFKPHPRINLAAALPLGFTSDCELVDIWLDTELPLKQIEYALKQACPPGLQIHHILAVEERLPPLQKDLLAADYLITFPEPLPDLASKLMRLLTARSVLRARRGKTYDLRPLILELNLEEEDETGCQRLRMRLNAGEGATGRPEEVILELGGTPIRTRIHRTQLIFREIPTAEN